MDPFAQTLYWRDPTQNRLLQTAADVGRLELKAVPERLQYVAQALKLIKPALNGRTALLGFSGSPLTAIWITP